MEHLFYLRSEISRMLRPNPLMLFLLTRSWKPLTGSISLRDASLPYPRITRDPARLSYSLPLLFRLPSRFRNLISKLFRESAEGFSAACFESMSAPQPATNLQFVIVFVTVTRGTRIHLLGDYIDALSRIGRNLPPSSPRNSGAFRSTTPSSIFAGIVWLLAVFAFLALAALFHPLEFAPRKTGDGGRRRGGRAS